MSTTQQEQVDWVLVHRALNGETTAGKLGGDLEAVVHSLRYDHLLGVNHIAKLLHMSGSRVLDTLDPTRVQQREGGGAA